ncbi:MAG: hypothetical protein OEO77_09560 [Acidimicrobiia bacterium]|nr:hypothetical protein [Acidimicrobiia bacterium]
MGLLNWIFDFYQQDQIAQVRQDRYQQRWEVLEEISAAREEAAALRSASGAVDGDRLTDAIGELALSVKALQRLLVSKGIVEAHELRAMVRSVDREDGAEDGQTPI